MDNSNECKCPFCDQTFIPEKGTTPQEHLAKSVLKVFAEMQHFPHDQKLHCPRCGQMKMREKLVQNALSRHFDVHICNECGTDEALRDYRKDVLPITAWAGVNMVLKCFAGISCPEYIPEKDSAYPLCDNPECEESAKCCISAHLEDDGGYSYYEK